MSRLLQGLRLCVVLAAAGLAVERLYRAFAATQSLGVETVFESSVRIGSPTPDPDALLRLVLTNLAQTILLGGLTWAFAKTLAPETRASRRTALANAIAVTLTAIAAAVILQWSLGRTALRILGDESPYAVVARTPHFAGTAVGIGGEEPDSSIAFKALARRPHATIAFLQLLAFGTPEAKVYGLCGLRRSAPVLYRHLSSSFRLSGRLVTTYFGCVVERVPMKDLVHAEHGVELAPGETAEEWFRAYMSNRTPGDTRPIPELDLDGGGYTSMFLDDVRPRLQGAKR